MATVTDTKYQFTSDKMNTTKEADKSAKAGVSNPKAQLDKDAFMKLLLTELQYQDPTSPMDTEKMLTQTSQLATLEMQENTNSAMKELVNQLKSNSSMYALSSLGKMANIGNTVKLSEEDSNGIEIPLYFANNAAKGTIEIKDSTSKVVRTISLEDIPAGVQKLKWDGLKNDGTRANIASYTVDVKYTDTNGMPQTTAYGNYPVEAVKFIDGKAKVKIAGDYIAVDNIKEFYDTPAKQANTQTSSSSQVPPTPLTPNITASSSEDAYTDAAEAEYNNLLNRG